MIFFTHKLACASAAAWMLAGVWAGSVLAADAKGTAMFSVKKIRESVVDPKALTYSKNGWGICPNGMTYQQDGLTSHNGWQYATYYDAKRRLCVARRELPAGMWDVIHFNDYTHKATDTHNVAVLGICPGNGTIHLAFDHHVHPLHYRVSRKGAATRPDKVKWTAGLFGPVTSKLDPSGKSIRSVTYPRFLTTPRGGLQLFWRSGSCGNGDCVLAEYGGKSGKWQVLGKITTRGGVYNKRSKSRYSYLNGGDYDANGRLHLSWCWRESGDVMTNHDLCYVYSDDCGRSWFNSAGKEAGKTGSKPVSVHTPGITVQKIGMNRGVLNSNSQAVDSKGRFHAVIIHMPDALPDARSWRVASPQTRYFHYWRDLKGTWHRNPINVKRASRPKLRFDKKGNLYMIFRSIQIAAATAANGWSDWDIIHTEKGRFATEPLIDSCRWREEGILSVQAQRRPKTKGEPTALCVFDFKPETVPGRGGVRLQRKRPR